MKKNKKYKSGIKSRKQAFYTGIMQILREKEGVAFNSKQLAARLGMPEQRDNEFIYECLLDLEHKGEVSQPDPGKFAAAVTEKYITGKADVLNSGNAYVISDESDKDIFISSKFLNGAFHGDIVKVYLHSRRRTNSPQGEIVEIISRGKSEYVGVLELGSKQAFVVPDSNRMNKDILVPLDKTKGAADGMKVQVLITQFPKNEDENPIGEVIKVLGIPGLNNTEIHAILAEYGLPNEFPTETENEAENIPYEISQAEIKKRRDFRQITTFTIDPVDAKDFDDALSILKLENGNWEIGIHIADVSFYVHPNSIIDREAVKRATSVYLVDRVVPMLPEKLSNGVCSLRPKEEKLCYSAVFELNDQAEVLNQWFGRTVIFSDRRFSYEEAQTVIESGEGDFKSEIHTLHKLAQIMRKSRFDNGALKVEQEEVKFKLDEAGNPVEVFFKVQKESNQLIEEFMLLANKKVAEYVGKKRSKQDAPRPFVYRIHDAPDPQKLQEFSKFVQNFGYKLKIDNPKQIAKSLNKLLMEAKGKPEENMIEQLAIRSMAKAIYTTKNIGHYGLGFEYYTHFTSPIRRYPDVMVHRLLDQYLSSHPEKQDENKLEALCKHSSERERLAAEAERASVKFKQVEYMSHRVGRTYAGVISGVTEWGMFVEITENRCEGLVRLRSLDDDFYVFDSKNFCIVGQRRKKKYRLGDEVNILVNKVDMEKRQIDLLIDNI